MARSSGASHFYTRRRIDMIFQIRDIGNLVAGRGHEWGGAEGGDVERGRRKIKRRWSTKRRWSAGQNEASLCVKSAPGASGGVRRANRMRTCSQHQQTKRHATSSLDVCRPCRTPVGPWKWQTKRWHERSADMTLSRDLLDSATPGASVSGGAA